MLNRLFDQRWCWTILCLLYPTSLFAQENTLNSVSPVAGNFALPSTQQPGAFISFGENVINKDQKQLYLFMDNYAGKNQRSVGMCQGK